tara:strand:- start:256 stop:588 length:333 start_codon:yes stop_codon:yes gene_type:complete
MEKNGLAPEKVTTNKTNKMKSRLKMLQKKAEQYNALFGILMQLPTRVINNFYPSIREKDDLIGLHIDIQGYRYHNDDQGCTTYFSLDHATPNQILKSIKLLVSDIDEERL